MMDSKKEISILRSLFTTLDKGTLINICIDIFITDVDAQGYKTGGTCKTAQCVESPGEKKHWNNNNKKTCLCFAFVFACIASPVSYFTDTPPNTLHSTPKLKRLEMQA